MNKKSLYSFILLVMGFLLVSGCTDTPSGLNTNQAPHTYLSLFPDSTISPHGTRLKIAWWGDDPDGFVAGYYFSFDSTNWVFTTKNDSTFQLAISGYDSTFRFWVAAVDDKGLWDPHPASNRYPVINTAPSVKFNAGTEIADTTFTFASFAWTGTDPDGDNTIKYYYWALNDTNNWHKVPSSTITLNVRQDSGLIPNSRNVMYLRAQDIAGTYSKITTMPDTGKTWYVRKPVGRFLLVNDYYKTPVTDIQQMYNFYKQAIDSANYPFSTLDIKVNSGGNIPKIKNPMFIETLKMFDCVIWTAWRGNNLTIDNANFDLAQQTLPYYILAGGKVFFTTGFPNSLTANDLGNFASIDSISYNEYSGFTEQYPVIVSDNQYDTLYVGSQTPGVLNLDRVRTLYPRTGTHVIYRIQNPNNANQSGVVCMKDTQSNPHVVFMSLALHRMNYTGSAVNFFRRVIHTDFGIN